MDLIFADLVRLEIEPWDTVEARLRAELGVGLATRRRRWRSSRRSTTAAAQRLIATELEQRVGGVLSDRALDQLHGTITRLRAALR